MDLDIKNLAIIIIISALLLSGVAYCFRSKSEIIKYIDSFLTKFALKVVSIRLIGFAFWNTRYFPSFYQDNAILMFLLSLGKFVLPISFYLLIFSHFVFIIRELVYFFLPGSIIAQLLTSLWFIVPFSFSSEFYLAMEMPPVPLEYLLDPFEIAELLGIPEEEYFEGSNFDFESLQKSPEDLLKEKELQELRSRIIKYGLIWVFCTALLLVAVDKCT